MDGAPAARDMPELVVSAAKDYLLCSEADLQQEWRHGRPLGQELQELLFGIKPTTSYGFLPASACRGPFLTLLRHHRREGLGFIIEVFNHSAEWYAQRIVQSEYVEPHFDNNADIHGWNIAETVV